LRPDSLPKPQGAVDRLVVGIPSVGRRDLLRSLDLVPRKTVARTFPLDIRHLVLLRSCRRRATTTIGSYDSSV
jgi:hypothetical protein